MRRRGRPSESKPKPAISVEVITEALRRGRNAMANSLVARSHSFGRARHLPAIHGQVTLVERHGSSWPWMRREGDEVPVHDSIEGMLVPFIGPDRACYLVAGLLQQGHAVIVSSPSEIVTIHRPVTSAAPAFAAADANSSRQRNTRAFMRPSS